MYRGVSAEQRKRGSTSTSGGVEGMDGIGTGYKESENKRRGKRQNRQSEENQYLRVIALFLD